MKKTIQFLTPVIILFASCKSSNIREPEYRDVRDVRVADVGILNTTAKLNMIYYNPNNFGVQLTDASGDVYIDNMLLGRFGIDEKVKVRKRKEFVVPAVFRMNNLTALVNYKEISEKKEAKIRIEGLARVKKSGIVTEVPIKYEGTQNIEKLKELFPR